MSTGAAVSRPLVVALFILGGWVASRLVRVMVRRSIRHVADRGVNRPSRWWRTRIRRDGSDALEIGEQRRRQRIDAASRMLSQLTSLLVWLMVAVAVFHVLDLNAAYFISSAGFIGAGLSIGGQHRVNDYLSGLAVLLEDRYGVGDEIEADLPWATSVHGVVEHIGVVTTRLRDGSSSVHIPHSSLACVRNLSQEPAETRLAVSLAGPVPSEHLAQAAAGTMRDLAGSRDLTQVLFVDDITAVGVDQDSDRVELNVRTSRPLTSEERQALVERTERLLSAATSHPASR